MIIQATSQPVIMGRLEHDSDLIDSLTMLCLKKDIKLGRVEAIGAVKKARLGYYNQETKQYWFFDINQQMEIISLIGNISVRNGDPMIHAHVSLADANGHLYGGHLAEGTIVFACEFVIQPFDGPELVRGHDDVTGLPLWQ